MEFTAVAEIVASEAYTHRAGGGVKFKLKTLDSSPRQLEYGICLKNPNPEVERTGAARMARLVAACRLVAITDTEQLHNRMIAVSYARNGYVTRVFGVVSPLELQRWVDSHAPQPRRWWQFWKAS